MRAVLGDDVPVQVVLPDGSTVGKADAPMRILVRSPAAYAHMLRAPGELGLVRAYVSGALDVEGDLGAAVSLGDRLDAGHIHPRQVLGLARSLGVDLVRNPPPIPPEEIVGHRNPVTRHTKERDASSVSHHYDVSNDFYRLILGPSMTYSCATFSSDDDSLEQAQQNKVELVCRKLALAPGMRLLDVGCGWGAMVLHAARYHGVDAVGVTISREQYEYAAAAVEAAGLSHRVEIRLQDYRDIADGPYDAISSIGMFEHVGHRQLQAYFAKLQSLLRDEGRLLNHQIGRRPYEQRRIGRDRTTMNSRGLMNRYVFPDGELHEVGDLVETMQRLGLEVRHVESLREHYDRTLKLWEANLDAHWAQAAAIAGEGRTRVWKLYIAASAVMFRLNRLQVHQILAVNVNEQTGRSAMGWRPTWETNLRTAAYSIDQTADVIDVRDPSSADQPRS